MKRSLISPPEAFSLSPLLTLLPSVGDVNRLDAFSSSLFARCEAVSRQVESLSDSADREAMNRMRAEESMLRTVLDWLSIKPGEAR